MEARQLATLIAKAGDGVALETRMLVGRADHRQRQLVTVISLKAKLAPNEHATIMICVIDLLAPPLSGTDLADLFGFTSAEDRGLSKR